MDSTDNLIYSPLEQIVENITVLLLSDKAAWFQT